jgi:hypothetical protein
VGARTLRQQCYVKVDEAAAGEIQVELMATLARLEIDPTRAPATRWITYASDARVEAQLLEEIAGRVLSLDADATVVRSNVPPLGR